MVVVALAVPFQLVVEMLGVVLVVTLVVVVDVAKGHRGQDAQNH